MVTCDRYDELEYDVLLQGQYDDLWDAGLAVLVAIWVEIYPQMKRSIFPLILELELFYGGDESSEVLRTGRGFQ